MENGPSVLAQSYMADFSYLLTLDANEHVTQFKNNNPDLTMYHDEIFKFKEAARRIMARLVYRLCSLPF